jgi:hypothetical protein
MSSPALSSLLTARDGEGSLSLRHAHPADARQVANLAAMEEVVLHGPVMVAAREDRVVAALSLHDGTVAADPFVRTADAVALLRLRARQERRSAPSRRRLGLRRAAGFAGG